MDIAERNYITRPHATAVGITLTSEEELPELLAELTAMDLDDHQLINDHEMMEDDTLDFITEDEVINSDECSMEILSPDGFDTETVIPESKRAKTNLSISTDDEPVDDDFDASEPCFFS